ncbi:HEAT repeat domain-containing protein [Streptomyces sp. UNOB3_S3]|uniref:HEAT repeat domain-containing protein n=1 Tax=Streptomyces sp. UNOB3_S3 TaxID=2871682 RepID=UPI001E4D2D24|nr:HEAT repeat domain-containing protein [Streptomyces sp. UNOB3_S3]MCC3773300.1 HEAT repeat domain-containing protein [Streptomyces sp. UNOB3_S3]
MTSSDESLLTAVRIGDTKAVAALLQEEYGTTHARGPHVTAALRLAADALDHQVLDVLLKLADLDALDLDGIDADGRTPLLRAVERGAYDIATTLHFAGADPRVKDREGRDALALARHWHATGTEAGVCRRTVRDGNGELCRELVTGEQVIRDGHTAILTHLEWCCEIATPFAELLDRAMAEPEVDHPVWGAAAVAAAGRKGLALTPVWDAAAALRHHPDPLARYFGADVLRCVNLYDDSGEDEESPFDTPLVDLFLPWVEQEEDPRVMRPLAAGLAGAMDSRAEKLLPALARHADAQVRSWAVGGLHWQVQQSDADALAAVLACTRDADARVREGACRALLRARADDPAPGDALATCLSDSEEAVRVTAAVQLALRGDHRGDALLDALDGTVDRTSPYYWPLHDVWRHRRNQ